MNNIYYSPEKFGLEQVGEVEFSSGSYGFDTSVVWRDKDSGVLYVADDSGCSCPSPFESIGRGDLTKINRTQDLIDYFEARKTESYRYDTSEYGDQYEIARIEGEIGAVIAKAVAS